MNHNVCVRNCRGPLTPELKTRVWDSPDSVHRYIATMNADYLGLWYFRVFLYLSLGASQPETHTKSMNERL